MSKERQTDRQTDRQRQISRDRQTYSQYKCLLQPIILWDKLTFRVQNRTCSDKRVTLSFLIAQHKTNTLSQHTKCVKRQ